MRSPDRPRRPWVERLDHVGLWAIIIVAATVIAANAWALILNVGALFGPAQPTGESLEKRVVESGAPPIFDEARGAVVIIGKFQWFGSANPGGTSAQLYLWGTLTETLVVLAISVMVLLLCLKLLRRRPFTRSVTWFMGGVGVMLMVGGMVSQLLIAISRSLLVEGLRYLGPPNGVTVPDPSWTVDLTPIAAGFVLAVIAGAFEIGERMQRDTEGLV